MGSISMTASCGRLELAAAWVLRLQPLVLNCGCANGSAACEMRVQPAGCAWDGVGRLRQPCLCAQLNDCARAAVLGSFKARAPVLTSTALACGWLALDRCTSATGLLGRRGRRGRSGQR